MTNVNRGYCIGCGEKTDERNCEVIGNTRIWTCGCAASQKEIREAYRDNEQHVREQAQDDDYNRYR